MDGRFLFHDYLLSKYPVGIARVSALTCSFLLACYLSIAIHLDSANSPIHHPIMASTTRRHDLDNLRTFLTCLVIVHHTSNCYGGPGSGPYKSELIATAYPASRLPLFVFNAFNHSFFMGVFFWISGRVSCQSLQRIDMDPRRTRWSFMRSKLLRLGIPAICSAVILEPITQIVGQSSWDTTSVGEFLKEYYATLDSFQGPIWYVVNLMLFDIVASLCCSTALRDKTKSSVKGNERDYSGNVELSTGYMLIRKHGWLAATIASFIIRLYYPVGVVMKPNGLQVAFAPQYIYTYALGFASAGAESTLTGPFTGTSVDSVAASILISLSLVPLPQVPQLFTTTQNNIQSAESNGMKGGLNASAFLYAFWNELSFALVGPALASLFYKVHNTPAKSRLFQSCNSYGAYLIHMLVSGVVERIIEWLLVSNDVPLAALVTTGAWRVCGLVFMTGLVGALNVVASFAVSRFLLDRLPALRRLV